MTALQEVEGFSEPVKNSLSGRIRELKRESVNFAIRNLVHDLLGADSNAILLIQRAYAVRSRLLHEGRADDDLEDVTNRIEQLIRRLIAAKLNLALKA